MVCLEVPRGPVLQCGGASGGGHITCDVCDRENEACPECNGEEKGERRVRVAVVEKVRELHMCTISKTLHLVC